MTLNPYPDYRDSGVDWLGDIPSHWGLEPLFGEYEEKQVKNTGLIETTVLSLSYGRVVVKPLDKLHGLVPESFETYQIIDPGDIIIRPTDLQNDHTSLRVGISRHRGIITSAYICLRTRNTLSSEYGYHVLNVFDLTKAIYGYGSGLRQNLGFDHLKRVRVPLPPPDEQDAIVRFLDAAEARIRRYIRAKQQLIKLLNEQKQAIIQQAVTRGLNPDAPMKDSGIAWLGQIPSHWEQGRLKFITSHIVDCLHATPKYMPDGQYPAIRTADIEIGNVNIENAKRLNYEQYLTWIARLQPKEGDILYSREGERYGIAALVPPDVELCISQRMMVFRIKAEHCSGFIMWQLNVPHVYEQASQDIGGATSPHVNIETIKNYWLIIPPIDEQEQIDKHVVREHQMLNEAIGLAKQEIDLIREYRTRLIADVVTGKVDVRGCRSRCRTLSTIPTCLR